MPARDSRRKVVKSTWRCDNALFATLFKSDIQASNKTLLQLPLGAGLYVTLKVLGEDRKVSNWMSWFYEV